MIHVSTYFIKNWYGYTNMVNISTCQQNLIKTWMIQDYSHLSILLVTSNHQTTNLVFPNISSKFFSFSAAEEQNKLFIDPNQVFLSIGLMKSVFFQLLELRKNRQKNWGQQEKITMKSNFGTKKILNVVPTRTKKLPLHDQFHQINFIKTIFWNQFYHLFHFIKTNLSFILFHLINFILSILFYLLHFIYFIISISFYNFSCMFLNSNNFF